MTHRKAQQTQMQILSVELDNVKSYDKATVTFSPGVNAIVGHNGAGKSTIVEAIGFVLFDSLDYNQADFVRGGMKSATASVTFVSSEDERAYIVQRRIGSSAHYAVHDPELDVRICDGKADVQRFLRQHLHIEAGADLASLFRDAVGVPQGTLTAAFLLNAADRKKIFDALLRVEEYGKAQEKLREPQSLLKTRRNTVAQEIARVQGRMDRLPGLESEAKSRRLRIDQGRAQLATLLKEFDLVQSVRIRLDQAREVMTVAERALHAADQELQGSTARLLAAQQGRADAEAARDLVTKHKAGYDGYLAAEAEQKSIDAQVRRRGQIEAQRAAVDRKLAQLEAEVKNAARELAAVVEAEQIVADLQAAVQQQTELERALEEARRQQMRLEEAQRRAAQFQAQLTRIEMRRNELDAQLREVTGLEAQVVDTQQTLDDARRGLDDQRSQLAFLKSQADLIKDQTEKLQDVTTAVCPVCEQPLQAAHRTAMLARNESRLAAMRQEYRQAGVQVKQLEATVQQQDSLVQQLQRKLLQLPRAEERSKLDEEWTRVEVARQEAQAEVAALLTAAGQVDVLAGELALLGDPRRRATVAAEQARRRVSLEEQQKNSQQAQLAEAARVAEFQTQLAEFDDLDSAADDVAQRLRLHREAYQAVLANERAATTLPAKLQEEGALAVEVEAQKQARHRTGRSVRAGTRRL